MGRCAPSADTNTKSSGRRRKQRMQSSIKKPTSSYVKKPARTPTKASKASVKSLVHNWTSWLTSAFCARPKQSAAARAKVANAKYERKHLLAQRAIFNFFDNYGAFLV